MLVLLDPLDGSRVPHDHALAWFQRPTYASSRIKNFSYVVLRAACTENVFVCCCGVGSDRVAGVGVSLGTLGLVRDDGRPCLGRCSHTTISRLRLSDRPLEFSAPARSCTVRAAVRRRAPGFFSGARLRAQASTILDAHFAQTAGSRSPELSSGDCKGAGEPGILSPELANARPPG